MKERKRLVKVTNLLAKFELLLILTGTNIITNKFSISVSNSHYFFVKCVLLHFSSLAFKLTTLPPKVVARRMLPRLMSRFVLAEPSAEYNFLPHLLTPIKGTLQCSSYAFSIKIQCPELCYEEVSEIGHQEKKEILLELSCCSPTCDASGQTLCTNIPKALHDKRLYLVTLNTWIVEKANLLTIQGNTVLTRICHAEICDQDF